MDTKYSKLTHEELLKIVDDRKASKSPNFEGVNPQSSDADIVAALTLDDEHVAAVGAPHKNLPEVEVTELPSRVTESNAPTDDKFTHGVFVHEGQNEKYALAVHEADAYGRTHSCKNTRHFWQGTKDEFNKVFNKQ